MENEPNEALERSRLLVTSPACAGLAPSNRLAQFGRSAKKMILRTQVTFSALGEHFVPSKVRAPFTNAHDPGEIGKAGRYRGIPDPNGWADFDVPEKEEAKIAYLHRIVVPLLPALRAAGAEDFTLRITYHCDSGAIGFTKDEIRMLVEMECDVPIDCLIEEEPNQSLVPTTTAVTSPAAQEPRQPRSRHT